MPERIDSPTVTRRDTAPRPSEAEPRPGVPLWLFALTAATFATGTDDMVIAGLLPALSRDLDVTEALAGQLVTGYALVFGLGAPVLAVLTARLPTGRLLLLSTVLFAVVNGIMAGAPSFAAMLALRMLAAALAAVMVPSALALVAEYAPEHRRGRWLSIVTAGITLSLIAGVPLGTWIGGLVHWRATMVFVMALSLLAALGMTRLPRTEGARRRAPELTPGERLRPLTRPVVLCASLAMVVAGAGGMMGYIYLAPLTAHLVGAGSGRLAVLIVIYGAAGFLGVLLGGRGADTIGPGRTLAIGFGCSAVMLSVIAVLAQVLPVGGVPFAVLAAVTVPWAAGLWSFSPPMQSWLLVRAAGMESSVLALNTSGMYLGFAVGGAIGGAVLAREGAAAIPIAATVLLGLGGTILALTMGVTILRERVEAREGAGDADR